jgi:hypothetical protein
MGYMDKAGKVVIPPKFDNAWPMREGYGNVMIGEKRGLIDQDGNICIKPQYRFDGGLESVQEGLVCFQTDEGRYGFLDPRRKEIIPARFSYALGFSEGLAPAQSDRRFGYIDKTGDFVIKPRFDHAWPFQEGLACVQVKEQVAFIDKSGAFVFGKKFGYAYSVSEGLAAINEGGRPPTPDPKD